MAQIIKLVEKGYEHFTGDIGGILFVDGVSEESLSNIEVNRIGAAMRIESIEGNQLGITAQLAEMGSVGITDESDKRPMQEPTREAKVHVLDEEGKPYTKESLEQIADRKGIAGLREVAEKFGVKGVSIAGIISQILETIG